MAIALDPTVGSESSEHYVDIEISSELTRGMTVVDRLGVAGNERNRRVWDELLRDAKKVRVYWSLDVAKWKAGLSAAVVG
jgi:purine nucleosidase